MNLKRDITFTLNGVKSRATVSADMTALAMLRDVLGLKARPGARTKTSSSLNSAGVRWIIRRRSGR